MVKLNFARSVIPGTALAGLVAAVCNQSFSDALVS